MSELITEPQLDPQRLRDVLGTFVTGVTVVTTCDAEGKRHGLTANSFSSVSLDPPLILWCQSTASKSYPVFRDTENFAINILAHDQMSLSSKFAKASDDRFCEVDCCAGIGGAPLLSGTSASLECIKIAAYLCGDHVVYIGRVARVSQSNREPLAICSGRYLSVPQCRNDNSAPHLTGSVASAAPV